MVRVDGDLDPETGESLLTALDAVLDAEAKSRKGDPRTPRSAEPTRSTRSVEAGSTPRIARASVESDLTSRSRSQRNNSRAARSGCSTMQESSRERRPSGSLMTRRSAGS
jgi:hypothetical protein